MSRCVNTYARLLLGLRTRDCSGAFRCYRIEVLRRIDLQQLRAQGYAYVEELLWRLKKAGARIGETPIVFVDRQRGQTKINWREAIAALLILFRLGIQNYLHF
jgi:dolichol-phosphate mannosyltransferase